MIVKEKKNNKKGNGRFIMIGIIEFLEVCVTLFCFLYLVTLFVVIDYKYEKQGLYERILARKERKKALRAERKMKKRRIEKPL